MAQRRMFSLTIVDTDRFLEMPASAQSLYFHLGMRADDEGFVSSPRKITALAGCAADDLKLLTAKGYIIPFDSGVCVITDWRQNNYIQSDRFKSTLYTEEKTLLSTDKSGSYTLCIQAGYSLDTQVRLGKDSIGEERLGEDVYGRASSAVDILPNGFDLFWQVYPKKVKKQDAQKAWKQMQADKHVDIIMAVLPVFVGSKEWTKDGGQFVPYPASWLRSRRWEDETAPPQNRNPYFAMLEESADEQK